MTAMELLRNQLNRLRGYIKKPDFRGYAGPNLSLTNDMKTPEVAFSEITAFQDQLWDDEVLYNALVVPHPEVWKATRRNDKDYESSLEFCYNAGEWLRREIALKYPELSENDVHCITEKLFDEYGTLHTDKFQLIRWRNMNDYRLCDKFSSQLKKYKRANQNTEAER